MTTDKSSELAHAVACAVDFIEQAAVATPGMTDVQLGAAMSQIARQCEWLRSILQETAAKEQARAALPQQAQDALDARRWRYAHEEPEAMRHLLRLLLDGKGKPSDLDSMVDKLIASKAAIAKGERHE